jgi:hypothetical protein
MEREDLVRLAGEQALLSKEVREHTAQFNRDKQALLALHNSIATGLAPRGGWLADGLALLTRLDENQRSLRDMNTRLADLAKLTGL